MTTPQLVPFLPDNPDYGRAGHDFYNVVITDGNFLVHGQMKENFKIKLSSEWGDLLEGTIPGSELVKKFGNSSFTTGIFSQKYFSRGGHYDITAEFRVLEDLSIPNASKIVTYARHLGNMASGDAPATLGQFIDEGQKRLEQTKEVVGTAASKGLKAGAEHLIKAAQAKAKQALNSRTVTLIMGTFFKCNGMIIKDVDIEYSREIITGVGPMYADFSIGLESIQAANRGKNNSFAVNSVLQNSVNRVTITNSSTARELPNKRDQ